MPQGDAELAVRAVEAACGVIRSSYGGDAARYAKSADDFATEVDIAAEEVILAVLRGARPDDSVLGEESGVTGSAEASRCWLVDPLCGTLNFAAQVPLVAVNVALRVGGVDAVAAVGDPFAAEVFWTDGTTAWLRSGGRDRPLTPEPISRLVNLNVDPPFPNADRFRAVDLLADDGFTTSFRPRVYSSTLALAWVAAGRQAAYVTDGHLRDSVHFAAGIALCAAAGCVVTSLDGGAVHAGTQGLIAATDANTHAELADIIARLDRGDHAR